MVQLKPLPSVGILTFSSSTVWLKVVDRASGKIVAGSQWKVFPSFSPASADDKPAEWLEGEDLTKATQILEKMNAARRAANPKGYVRESCSLAQMWIRLTLVLTHDSLIDLHICFTHPNYRRKGAGGMVGRLPLALSAPALTLTTPDDELGMQCGGCSNVAVLD